MYNADSIQEIHILVVIYMYEGFPTKIMKILYIFCLTCIIMLYIGINQNNHFSLQIKIIFFFQKKTYIPWCTRSWIPWCMSASIITHIFREKKFHIFPFFYSNFLFYWWLNYLLLTHTGDRSWWFSTIWQHLFAYAMSKVAPKWQRLSVESTLIRQPSSQTSMC